MSPFNVDWKNLEAVKSYAKKLVAPGFPQTVLKHKCRPNYNIGDTDTKSGPFSKDLAAGLYEVVVKYIVVNGIVFGSDEYNLTTFEKLR